MHSKRVNDREIFLAKKIVIFLCMI